MFINVKRDLQKSFNEALIHNQFLFVTNVDPDKLWDAYLSSFSDPAERQSHNCNACRRFIRNYGGLVFIQDLEIKSLWDFTTGPYFQPGVSRMNQLVLSSDIVDVFVSDTKKMGLDKNRQTLESGEVVWWNHFYTELPSHMVHKGRESIESVMGDRRTAMRTLQRSLDEISIDTTETVLELIAQNSLYRGSEFKGILKKFLSVQKDYANKVGTVKQSDIFCWSQSVTLPGALCRIRNSAIGTLLVDISTGAKTLDKAVESFEKKVAPANYKRPTPVVTRRMVEDAQKLVESAGVMDSLSRRFATVDDIELDNALFVNRDAKKAMGVFEEMKEEVVVNPKNLTKVEEIPVDKFVKDVLPTITSLDVLVENRHMDNMASIITAKNDGSPTLFKWDNPFSWTYTNSLADSDIKDRVVAAGGKVDGHLRVSLSWKNYDDLDIHVVEPNNNRIYYSSKVSGTSGRLDVDMNAHGGTSRKPVENIVWTNKSKMKEGKYKVYVNNYKLRERTDVGFTVQIECQGEVHDFNFDKSPSDGKTVKICEFTYSKKDGITFEGSHNYKPASNEKWGISTNSFQKVSLVMNSPNHWSGESGNRHLFFIIDGAKNDENPRGFFNEFLKEDYLKSKRAFEILGSKFKVEDSDQQLSGLGFSSTKKNHLICRVEGKFKRTLKVIF